MQKKCKIIMLPTNELLNAGQLVIYTKDNTLNRANFGLKVRDIELLPQHLYICSQEEIKKGDWFYIRQEGIIGEGNIMQCIKILPNGNICCNLCRQTEIEGYFKGYITKIIATTDSSLVNTFMTWASGKYHEDEPVLRKNGNNSPIYSIPKDFIQQYIKMYNTGEQIKEVMVEYEGENEDLQRQLINIPLLRRPKLNNNEIIIKN